MTPYDLMCYGFAAAVGLLALGGAALLLFVAFCVLLGLGSKADKS